jgi:hypothetical protein
MSVIQARAEVAERHYQEARANAIRAVRDAEGALKIAADKAIRTGRQNTSAGLLAFLADLEALELGIEEL